MRVGETPSVHTIHLFLCSSVACVRGCPFSPCREWFQLLSHEMFNPYYGLFEYSARCCVRMTSWLVYR